MNLFKIFGLVALNGVDKVRKELGDTTGQAEGASGKMSAAFKKIGTAVATYFAADKIISFGKGCIEAAADASAMEAQFSSVFGDMEGQASKSLSKIAKNAGISENRMKGSFTKIAAFAKTTGMDTEGAMALSERAMVAVADSAAFYDRSLEDTTESLQSFLKGNYENDAALGLSCTETTRNAAANELYGKSFKDLSESQKQLTLLKMVEDANAASGALGQAARESETWTNVTGNLKQSWTDFQAVLGKPVLELATKAVGFLADKLGKLTKKFSTGTNPVQWFIDKLSALKGWLSGIAAYAAETFEPVLSRLETAWTKVKDAVQPLIDKLVDYVTNGELAKDITDTVKAAIDLLAEAAGFVVDALKGFSDWCMEHKGTVETIAIVVGSFAAAWALVNGAMKVWQIVGVICTAVTTAFGAAVNFLTSPVTLAILAIGALIAVGVLLYKNWDLVKEKAAELWAVVSGFFVQLWADISTACANIWSSVTTWFTNTKDAIVQKAQEIWTSVTTWFTNTWTSISTACSNIWSSVTTWFTSTKDAIVQKAQEIWSSVSTWFTNTWTSISTACSNIWSSVTTWFASIKSSITTKAQEIWSSVTGKFTDIYTGVSSTLSNMWTTVTSRFSSIKSSVEGKAQEIWSSVTGKFTDIYTGVSSTLSNMWTTVTSRFESVRSTIKEKIEAARDLVGNAVDKVKGFFDFEFKWPKIPMPHFGISPSGWKIGDLLEGSIPKLSISWYAKAMNNAMLLDKPSIFGYDPTSGKLLGGGENGSEVVAGTGTLLKMIQSAVETRTQAQTNAIIAALDSLTEAIVGGNAETLAALREGHTIVLNNREFGRAVREYA